MRVPTLRLAALALMVVLAACSQPPRGSLDVTIDAVPGTTPSVLVTGPGYSRTLSSSTVLTGLAVGTYIVTTTPLEIENVSFAGVERFVAANTSASVAANQTVAVAVAYAYEGFTITDPTGDAVGVSPNQPIYDLTQVDGRRDGDTLVLRLTLAEGQDDFADFLAYLHIDVDRDAATGEAFFGEEYCGAYATFGGEFVVGVEAVDAGLFTEVGGAPIEALVVSVAANTMTIEVPLTLFGGEARVHVATIVGNLDEPTDCAPFGVVVFVP
jgi:hypothetical protein